MQIYEDRKQYHTEQLKSMNQTYSLFGFIRFGFVVLMIAAIYFWTKENANYWWLVAGIGLAGFLFMARRHQLLAEKMEVEKTLLKINKDELAFLEGELPPYDDGAHFESHHHNYTFDLDFFGAHSLYQHLNRAATFIGKLTLANHLKSHFSKDEIEARQAAVAELAPKVEWRQAVLAQALLTKDSERNYRALMQWSSTEMQIDKSASVLSFAMPILFLIVGIASIITNSIPLYYIAGFLFLTNLSIFGRNLKHLKKALAGGDKIHEAVNQYAVILAMVEAENFDSAFLKTQQAKLQGDVRASKAIGELSNLFSTLGTFQNMLGAMIMNGTALYHLHVYRALIQWKTKYAASITTWLEVLGEIEQLNSLANFAHNNPENAFPKINESEQIAFEDLGHPLIDKTKRVCNSVDLSNEKFIILTGSNMAGKSTFLRSLGINLVLSGMGSAVCASKANYHPKPLFVSMRLNDSLSENESYFFAEVKRLQSIMQQLDDQNGYVLLDEILRGTNSDDKRTGTIEVIKKLVAKNAIGAIATHDVEVCKTTNEYPNYLTNKRFETSIVNNELLFDYKLKDGICENKSAYFLMKQMEVI